MDLTPSGKDELQRAALLRQRRIATGLLLLMAALFLAARFIPDPGFWAQLLEAGAEAALVGGLADWFAVTALFRQPLGLPIPHTAIIPRNKARIGEGLGRFVEQHFLAPELVSERLRRIDFAEHAAAWLAKPENAHRLSHRAAAAVPYVMTLLQDRELQDFFRRTLNRQIEQVNLAPVAGRLLRILTESDQHQVVFDQALRLARDFVRRHEERIYEIVADRSQWWVPSSVDRAIAARIIRGVLELLEELEQHDHEARRGFRGAIEELIHNLEHSTVHQARVEEIKRQLLSSPTVQAYLGSLWERLRVLVEDDVNSPSSRLHDGIAMALQSFALHLPQDEGLRQRINRRVEKLVIEFVVPWRTEIGNFIAEVVRSWDTRTVTERVELAVGRDLQYIRINGTLVGALVGCTLFLLTHAIFGAGQV